MNQFCLSAITSVGTWWCANRPDDRRTDRWCHTANSIAGDSILNSMLNNVLCLAIGVDLHNIKQRVIVATALEGITSQNAREHELSCFTQARAKNENKMAPAKLRSNCQRYASIWLLHSVCTRKGDYVIWLYRLAAANPICPIWLLAMSFEITDVRQVMKTSSNGNIFALFALCVWNLLVTGEFLSQRPVTRSFGVLFDLCQRLSKQSWRRWFKTPSPRSLWHHCNVYAVHFKSNAGCSKACLNPVKLVADISSLHRKQLYIMALGLTSSVIISLEVKRSFLWWLLTFDREFKHR